MNPRRYELSDFEWSIIQPLLPDKPRGVPRADDRKVLNGIYWRLRTGSPWADIPERYGPPTTCANRFRRWAKIGVWDRIFEAVSKAYDGDLQMIDASSIRVHQHGGNVKKGKRAVLAALSGSQSAWDTLACPATRLFLVLAPVRRSALRSSPGTSGVDTTLMTIRRDSLGRPLGRGRASSLSHAVMESPRAFCIGGAGPSSALRNERGPRPG